MERIIEVCSQSSKLLIQDLLIRAENAVFLYNSKKGCNINYLKRICFSSINTLGKYFPDQQTVVLSDSLNEPGVPKEFLYSVLLHETAHHICYIIQSGNAHNIQFRTVCREIGAPEEFSHSKVNLKTLAKDSQRLNKIRKLLALGESSNINEARLAIKKARELMGSSFADIREDQENIYTAVLISFARLSIAYRIPAITAADTSGVFLINEKTGKNRGFRVFGTKSQVETACYIYDVLYEELKREYKIHKKINRQAGRTLESFYYGVYNELLKKNAFREEPSIEKALQAVKNDNEKRALEYYYKEDTKITRKRGNSVQINRNAFSAGQNAGHNLTISKGIQVDLSKIKKRLPK